MMQFSALPPLSLYIHVPWCVRKCPYCDFNSHHAPDSLPEDDYIAALISDLEQDLPLIWGRTVQTIFIGGGTPSLFSAKSYERLFSALRARLNISPQAEITMEANPGTFEAVRFKDYRDLGINRLSVGIQSFNDQALKKLGRIHGADEAKKAIDIAYQAGFDNLNIDLMFGLPGQNEATARHDVETALALSPSHISYYQLTIEPNTLFYAQPPVLPAEDPIIDWQLANQQRLSDAGYQQYEVSAYAKPRQQCRHNLNYWQYGDYLGIGAGAHSKITRADKAGIQRRVKQKQPRDFIANAGELVGVISDEWVQESDVGFEFMLNALRLNEGVPTPMFMERTGLPLSHFQTALDEAEEKGLLDYTVQHIRPTALGRQYLNTLIELFLPQ